MSSMQNAYALIIGIANYYHIRKLPPVVLKDASDVCSVLINPENCGYQPDNVQLLIDGEATRPAIMQALIQLSTTCDADSIVFIYLSSHGGRIEEGPYAGEYLLPYDVVYESEQTIAQTAISSVDFTQALHAISARKLVVIFDCCHSGGIGEPKVASDVEMKIGLSDNYYKLLSSGRGRAIIASSRSNEYSWILPGDENSLFTKHLLAGLRGGAPSPGGVIRIFNLFEYIQPRVTQDKSEQHPLFKAELEENFPIALNLEDKSLAETIDAGHTSHSGDFLYDVFISYRHQDKEWVQKKFVPSLVAAGIKVFIDYKSFRLGAPLVTEMARGVEQSRYTLAVLTPAYLESNFTELENILAESLGLEKSQRRLIAVMKEECTPRLGIRIRPWLDMTDEMSFDENTKYLIYELRLPPSK